MRKTIQDRLKVLIPKRKVSNKKLQEKIHESVSSVLPISLLVLILSAIIVPVDLSIMSLFVVGAAMLIFGMGLFTLGADMAMVPMGNHLGSQLTKSKTIWILAGISFLMGLLITIASPITALAVGIFPAPRPMNIASSHASP